MAKKRQVGKRTKPNLCPAYKGRMCPDCEWYRLLDRTCHRLPPYGSAFGQGLWPTVGPDDWCGEWDEAGV